MNTYIAQTERLKNAITQYDNALQLLTGASNQKRAEAKAEELKAKGYVVTKIEEEDGEFFIYGREKQFKVAAYPYTDNCETEGYTIFTAQKISAPETDGGEAPEYIVFDRNSIKLLDNES